ncbi:MAG: molecular chaperone HtpG [Candidatus Onthovivens sp.]|nr:molecular chaperone HtpG [Candidatus Onthovivens sp.]
MIETKEFQTESKQLLNLMINSIYTNKEIFLRELISNASDAIDKYKYLQLTSEGKLNVKDYQIYLVVDKQNRTLTIKDNGIGMSHDDLVNSLGTIASSGSKEFLKKYKEAKDSEDLNIIGQFGVGFYSAFMVASKIEVLTKTVDDKAYKFSSDGVKEYTIEEATKEDTGTEITLYLKEDKDDENYSTFLEYYTLEDLVKKYSDYIRYPIKLDEVIRTPKKDEKGEEIKDEYDEKVETKILNSMIPLWKKNKKDVTEEDLNKFYKDNFSDYEDPLLSLNLNLEGVVSFNSLVFIPSHAPYDLYSQNYEKGLKLYIKGIFIKEKAKELVPDYLKFIKGLVDTNDLSLNISREMLQDDPRLRKMSDSIEKKVVGALKDLKNNDFDKYLKFYKLYGDHLMYGIYSSYGYKKDLLGELLVFKSLNSEKDIDLKTYKDQMKEGQKVIYYASGKSIESIKMLPEIEKFRKDGINVLFLTNDIDEFALSMMGEYEKVSFKNISEHDKEELNEDEKSKLEVLEAENKELLDNMKESLAGKVDEVILSNKLVESPVCISTKNGLSLNMERTLNEGPQGEQAKASKVLEINPNHEIFKTLNEIKADKELVNKYSSVLYNEAMLLEGFDVENKSEFIKNLNDIVIASLKK